MKAKEAIAAKSLPRSLREIYQCYTKLVDEILRAESTKYTVAQAYERGYTFEFGSHPARIKLYLAHRLELNSDLKQYCRNDPVKHHSRTVCQIVKLPGNFVHFGVKF